MLKIKDSVDLKELEKFIKQHKYKEFGIWKQYNSSTGELEKVWIGKQWNSGGHSYVIQFDTDDMLIHSAGTYDLDFLYDIIQAGLVEKVNGE